MSESNKFTPGPWFNGQDGFNLGCGVVYARHANGNPKDVATIRGWGGEQQQNSRLIASAPDLLEALAWALPLAKIAMEDHRMGRLRAGHDMTGTYKSGETWVGIYQDEIDKIEYAEYSLAKARGQQ